MEINEALSIASEAFPEGVEALAQAMGTVVLRSPLRGCEGWCIRKEDGYLIRINSDSPRERQRFTLAHELSHILLGTTPDIPADGCSEEQAVNNFAAVLLLPPERMREQIDTERPISAATVRRLSKAACVSQMMLARRIVTMAESLGIAPAYAAEVTGGDVRWVFKGNACSDDRTKEIVQAAREAGGSIQYERRGMKFAANLFETGLSTTLLVQCCR